MADPCCPDRANDRGRPYTSHWFVIHDGNGAIDTGTTWQLGGLPKSDVELAALVRGMLEAAGCPAIYAHQTKRWYMWDGSGRYAQQKPTFAIRMAKQVARWHQQATDDLWSAVRERVQQLPEDIRAEQRKLAKDAWHEHRLYRSKIWNDNGQRGLINQMEQAFTEDAADLDRGTGAIVTGNGVIRYSQVLRDGYVILEPHNPGDLVTYRCGPGVEWDADAEAPAFRQMLRDSVADPDQRFWLLWRTVNALFGRMPRKGFVNAIGEKDSGKSTFTDTIALLGGDYARTVPVETFLAKHAGDSGFRQHELMGARFVYTHEPNPGALYDVSFMKTLTGRDRMRTAGKHEKPVEWVPQCTPFIGSNGPIRFSTADDAMMSRQEAVRFARGYAAMDPFLADRVRGELPGILRMLVSCIEWEARHGLPDLPLSIIIERERMAIATEDALDFIAEWIERGYLRETGPDCPVSRCAQVQQLYTYFRYWCEEAGTKPVGRKTFSAVIGRKFPTGRANGIRFTGLELSGEHR